MNDRRPVMILMASAWLCLYFSVVFGILSALYYIPSVAPVFQAAGLSLQELRPLHTTFVSAWLFVGAVSFVLQYLIESGGELKGVERGLFVVQISTWVIAGVGALGALLMGFTSGREYIGFPPIISVFIMVGWIAFLLLFAKRVWRGFWSRPVYVYMWGVGVFFFVWTFTEGHAWMLRSVQQYPVADIQIQWKSCGTLVASFNQMVYGCLFYLGEKLGDDERIAHSQKAFALFGVGLLNSFTNYAHHTYHLPQSEIIKWVAFIVSMLEIIILYQVLKDVLGVAETYVKGKVPNSPLKRFVQASKCWNLFLLTLALGISIPTLNTFIHGTHVVMAHAMGSEIAIDTYILLAVFVMAISEYRGQVVFDRDDRNASIISNFRWMNLALILLVTILMVNGLFTGMAVYFEINPPAIIEKVFPFCLAFAGITFAFFLLRILNLLARAGMDRHGRAV